MNRKIIVAGAGHGGIAVAKLLSEKGFSVEVIEKNSRENMGYDWTDIFDPKALLEIGLNLPPKDKFEYKVDMTFYSTNEKKAIKQRVPKDQLEIKMERKDIYDMLISAAENAGVRFIYNCNIQSAIISDSKVSGIKTDKGEFFADLIIDAAGCESPVRASLPESFGVQAHPDNFEKFYIYRAFFNKGIECDVKDQYKVCLLPEGKVGIGWVATEKDYTDLLIGRFEPFDFVEAERTAEYYRAKNPSLGTEIKRGNCFAQIPVRQPISVMVANGYASIGDSAFMTVPIIGSGIANSLKAAPMLAKAVIENKDKEYTAESLWQYQKDFYKQLGSGLAPLAVVKLLLTKITPQQLDYIFEKNLLTWREMTITADTTKLSKMMKFAPDVPIRAVNLVKNKDVFKLVMGMVKDVVKVIAVVLQMPKEYHKEKVSAWAKKYDELFKL